MTDRLQKYAGKKAVVTGAASGLGRSFALHLAHDGWKVGVVDVNVPEAERTLEMVEKAGGSGEVFECDVGNADRVMEMAEHFFDAWGGVSLLINNAGIAVVGFMGDIEIDGWRRIIDTNLMGVIYGCHAFVPRMKAQGGGYIINTSSAAAFTSLPEMGPYNVTKAGVVGLSETLRAELAPDHIGVTVFCPLFVDTNLDKTQSHTDEFQLQLHVTAAKNAKMSADDVTRIALKSARRGRLYSIPQLNAKLFWLDKRLTPSIQNSTIAFLYKIGVARALVMWAARHGLT